MSAEHEKNIARLKKLMALTRSDNDHEALIAMRQANKILMSADISWDYVLDAAWPKKKPVPTYSGDINDIDLSDLFDQVFNTGRRR